ncbi:hypothetical protein PGUG_05874 [Meyerozyma guilliermondii ATCC 6260]|uniref:GPI-anchored protein 43 n=1 Tax=Meyerozyma guilliermondii (strain ATCC 6260 / CBS 566 / DSM 6381 / JCM 1539 / NBRC 10279 / NRRL Y-324) TaxID=294746 RepID=A5DRH3_PICGU|nr:uncharacterized protein PGUG_05874 [Meyerozyma guilliermondii ATCC 6260]EDK41776.2 hypothetical protein PGUG_05874 [Meyerozyma guilliermondii ATCC 6260]
MIALARNRYPLVFVILLSLVSANSEYGSYRNPNPLPQDVCESKDLIKLNSCSNEMLGRLQQCKANDRACECCALQSLKPTCFELCPGSPASNLLSVIIDDCAELGEVNACDLPFMRSESSYLNTEEPSDDLYYSKYTRELMAANEKDVTESTSNATINDIGNFTDIGHADVEEIPLLLNVSNSSSHTGKFYFLIFHFFKILLIRSFYK